jgi:hypothetical protein
VRNLVSAGLVALPAVPAEAVPEFVEAWHDPETRVRANAVRVFLGVNPLPAEAVACLRECARDADDTVPLNAARVLRNVLPSEVQEVFTRLLDDPNARRRLLAAGALLAADPMNETAAAVVVATLRLAPPGLRRDVIELIAALGAAGRHFRDALVDQAGEEVDLESSGRIDKVFEGLPKPALSVIGQV